MFADELDQIAARVSAGTNRKGYIATYEDDYDEESTADSVCKDQSWESRQGIVNEE